MPSTIEQTKDAILKHGGKASKHQIARELKISLDYAGLILGELKRKGEIAFSNSFYVSTPLEVRRQRRLPMRERIGLLTGLTSAKKDISQDKEQNQIIPLKRPKKAKTPKASKRAPHSLTSILGISESLALTLEKAGYITIESLAEAPISKLMAAANLELHTAAQLINQARKSDFLRRTK
ncbi:hypothetical protein HY798_00575 [Candidatus Falkowbacteria bacterium]|nr:hypothetical protein [Candidatus Falkowbacteria bacterium]